jgi:hypothetical protein
MIPISTAYICKVFVINHILWIDRWINHHAYYHTWWTRFAYSQLSGDAAGVQMLSWWSCLGSRPTWIGPHTHGIHMQGVWHHSYAMDWLIDPLSCLYWHTCWTRFAYSWKIEWRSWATNDIMVRCGWVFKPTWHGPHIHCVIHMQGVIHHSYAMDWPIDQPSCCYQHTCWTILANSWKFELRSWGTNNIMVEWLRLQTHMEWSPYPLHTYARC